MLKDKTRQAISSLIMLSLRGGTAVQTVKAAKEIFNQEWSNNGISLMCEHIREHGASDWANEIWENDVDQIYKQLILFTLKATDFQLALWLEKTLNDGEKALKFLCGCEEEFQGVRNDFVFQH